MPSPLSPHRFRLTPGPRGSLAFLACLGLTSVGRVPFPTHSPLTQVGPQLGVAPWGYHVTYGSPSLQIPAQACLLSFIF